VIWGSGGVTNLMFPFLVNFSLPIAALVGSWILLDRETTRADLGAAGLLKGYKATSHWITRDILSEFGAIPVDQRVVVDRNRITGAGVTAGLDLGLQLVRDLRNRQYAEAVQLFAEYDPKPPLDAGSQAKADPQISGLLMQMHEPFREMVRALAKSEKGPK